ncbi:MAG: hypothetical protein ACQESK_07020 [Bacteroidota bacterium]
MFKNGVFIILVVLMFGCTPNKSDFESFQLSKIKKVELPQRMVYQKKYTIKIHYSVPNTCYNFSDLNIQEVNNNIYIGVVTHKEDHQLCETVSNQLYTEEFEFIADEKEVYHFYFYQKLNKKGEKEYLSKSVPVIIE